MTTKYRYHFFKNVRARGEFPRLLFVAAGVPYEDVRCERHGKEWDEKKPQMPGRTLPVLELNGELFDESVVIARYLAREFGLTGKTNYEQLLTDTIVEKIIQVRESFSGFVFEKDEEKKAAAVEKFTKELLPLVLGVIENIAAKNKESDFLVGDSLTWADLAVFDLCQHLTNFDSHVLDNYPNIAANYKLVPLLPRLDDYLRNRPVTVI
ncbi:hypothetical protein LOTGIDRAFT_153682 [Lottia gigantea]|uniref:glutathione transferase n=1 Tax=Lottia gigantea TaxID=225164 RepID=V4A874_LOTGI|nr:hypothetical protein LOTGIDRAFT_153682 [Lottia gigantea]ESO91250.1 hypothetical protein LOTGIDRAFT_153682 [Lottia gigantea]